MDTKKELASLDSDFHDQTLGHHIVTITVDSVTLWSPAQCNIAIENPNRITGKIRDHYLYTNGLNGWITIKTPITEDCSQVKHRAIPTHSHCPLLQDPLRAAAMRLNPHPPRGGASANTTFRDTVSVGAASPTVLGQWTYRDIQYPLDPSGNLT